MSNAPVVQQSNALTGSVSQRALAYMQQHGRPSDELAGGITGGFGVVSYKGKTWAISYQGVRRNVERKSPSGPFMEAVPAIPVVIIAATPHITKTWYKDGYTEGSNAAPDCASSDGIKPDVSSPMPQNNLCATCPHNQFGSRVSQDGKGKGKACADAKRLAVVPSADIRNEEYGGPMLMRVPAASLAGLQKYAGDMERQGYPFYGIGTWLRFDGDDAYPKILFSPERPLTDAEVDQIIEYRASDQVKRILNSGEFATPAGAEAPAPATPQFSATPPGEPAPVAPAASASAASPTPPAETAEQMQTRLRAELMAQMAQQQQPAPAAPASVTPQAETAEEMMKRLRAELEAEKAKREQEAIAEAQRQVEAETARKAVEAAQAAQPPAETEAEMRARLMAEMAKAAPAAASPAPEAATPAQPAPAAPAPSQPTQAATGVQSANSEFDSYLGNLMGS